MGRWIEWRVEVGLDPEEITRLEAIVDGSLRKALPDVARQIRDEPRAGTGPMARLFLHLNDRSAAEYAADPQALVIEAGEIHVVGTERPRRLTFSPSEGEYAGHTVGFQDYASIGVLAAASQVSGKIVLVGGDDFGPSYVDHILERLERAGAGLRPEGNFAASLELESDEADDDPAY
ncbi:hypothetical protein GOB57_09375 [Sinorhizobium meliloti]|nr:hypothetical protein [Sinorhizobium meliloti]